MDLSAYRALLRTPGVPGLLLAALLARLPVIATLVPIAFLAKDAAGSFGWSGVVAGAYSVGMAVAGPSWSRLADRRGARRVLISCGMAWSLAILTLALLPGEWFRLMPLVALLAGAAMPPVGPTMRAAWPRLVTGRALRTVYTVDATAQEVLFATGPMLGALMVSFASPRFGLIAAAAAAGLSIWWFGLRQPAAAPHGELAAGERLNLRGLLWHRNRLPILVSFGLCVMAFASMSIGIVAFADERGNRVIAGVLEMVWALGSLLGGLVAGALTGRRKSYPWRRVMSMSAGMLLCVFATRSPVALGAALMLAGCATAPSFGVLYERLGAFTPISVRTEIFGWMNSGAMLGAAVGSVIAGAVVDAFGVPYVFAMATGLTVLSGLTLIGIPPHCPGAGEAADQPPGHAERSGVVAAGDGARPEPLPDGAG